MAYELHERILLYLFERRQTSERHKGYVEAAFPSGIGWFGNYGQSNWTPIQESIDARILPAGIEHAQFITLSQKKTAAKNADNRMSIITKVFILVASGVLVALILWLIGSYAGIKLF